MSFRAFDLLNLVKDFGEPLTYRQVTTEGTYNPNTGSVTGAATTDTNFTGYMYDYVSQNASEEPEPDDTIVGSGDTVKVSRVVTLFSAGTAVCYICDVEE